jgi:hypothetical protein
MNTKWAYLPPEQALASPPLRWVLLFTGLVITDGVLLALWLGGTTLDEDCEEVERTPEKATDSDWACTGFIQDVGPYAIVPLVVMLGVTLVVLHQARRRP